MNEGQKALEAIKFWLVTFFVCFVVFSGVALGTGIAILRDVSAFNSCASVEDSQFKACYESAKQ